jgi:hypothetical protein
MESREQLVARAEESAKEYNDGRPWWKKLLGKDMFSAMDVLHNTAEHEFRNELDCLFDGAMSISSWEKISQQEFNDLITKATVEWKRENTSNTDEKVFEYYRIKALRFAQWLDDTKYRPFFMGSENKIEQAISHIRSIAK